MIVAHFAFNFRLGHQGGHAVHHHHIQRIAADELVGNGQGLLAIVGLADQQVVRVHPKLLGVNGVQGVLGVNEGAQTAHFLGLGHEMQSHGGLAAALRAKNFHNAAPGNAANAQRAIQHEAAGRNDAHIQLGALVAQAHHRTLAELLVNLTDGVLQGFLSIILLCHAFL